MRSADVARSLESIYGYYKSKALDAKESVKSTSGTERSKREIRTLHRCMRMNLDGLKLIRTAGFRARYRIVIELNRFSITACYCSDAHEDKRVSKIRHRLSVRRSCVRYLITIEDIY